MPRGFFPLDRELLFGVQGDPHAAFLAQAFAGVNNPQQRASEFDDRFEGELNIGGLFPERFLAPNGRRRRGRRGDFLRAGRRSLPLHQPAKHP
eukprot:4959800-Prymnesium_polylepis.1